MDEGHTNGVAGTRWSGTRWSETEVSAVVESYFRMLAWERAGTPYNKSESRLAILKVLNYLSWRIFLL